MGCHMSSSRNPQGGRGDVVPDPPPPDWAITLLAEVRAQSRRLARMETLVAERASLAPDEEDDVAVIVPALFRGFPRSRAKAFTELSSADRDSEPVYVAALVDVFVFVHVKSPLIQASIEAASNVHFRPNCFAPGIQPFAACAVTARRLRPVRRLTSAVSILRRASVLTRLATPTGGEAILTCPALSGLPCMSHLRLCLGAAARAEAEIGPLSDRRKFLALVRMEIFRRARSAAPAAPRAVPCCSAGGRM